MFIFKSKKNTKKGNQYLDTTSEDDTPFLNLVYKKVPMTLEIRRRQYEEQLRIKYSIKKEKIGKFL